MHVQRQRHGLHEQARIRFPPLLHAGCWRHCLALAHVWGCLPAELCRALRHGNGSDAPTLPCCPPADYKGLKDEIKAAAEETKKVRRGSKNEAAAPSALLRQPDVCIAGTARAGLERLHAGTHSSFRARFAL